MSFMTGLSAFSRIPISTFRKFIPALALLFLLPTQAPCAQVCDDYNFCLNIEKPASRIIALYGAFNEILLALGAKDSLVGRTAADKDIGAIAHLPAVGTHMRPNAELVTALKPDLILQMAGRGEAMALTENLRGLGFNVLVFDINSFEKLFDATIKLGELAGKEVEAAALVNQWKTRLAKLPKRVDKPSVYYEAREPNLLAAGAKSMVDAIIKAAGGENIVKTSKKLARFNEEALILANPDFCLVQKGPMSPAPRPIAERPNLKNLKCAKAGHNYIVDERLFSRPGPNSVEAAEWLGKILGGSGQ